MKTLVLGGASSGKSQHAEALAQASGKGVVYIATAPRFPDDKEWQQRIGQHKKQRPISWELLEEELSLMSILHSAKHADKFVLVDCLTLWLSNVMFAKKDIALETHQLCKALADYSGDIVLVSNEVGMGLVAETKLGRSFCDAQGRLNQAIAKVADEVFFVAAGLPLQLK